MGKKKSNKNPNLYTRLFGCLSDDKESELQPWKKPDDDNRKVVEVAMNLISLLEVNDKEHYFKGNLLLVSLLVFSQYIRIHLNI